MYLKEIIDLIKVREYMARSINNMAVERQFVNKLNSLLPLVDNKIIGMLMTNEFEDYIKKGN